jgi:hypothetical protein
MCGRYIIPSGIECGGATIEEITQNMKALEENTELTKVIKRGEPSALTLEAKDSHPPMRSRTDRAWTGLGHCENGRTSRVMTIQRPIIPHH